MHLVISTHLSLFLVVCHPSTTFPPKVFEWEPQNRLPLLPIARPYPLLPLTHGPPLLYWLGTGWCCLILVHAPLLCVSKACLLLMCLPWPRVCLCVLLLILNLLWREQVSEPSFFMTRFLHGLGIAKLWAFLSLMHSLLLS